MKSTLVWSLACDFPNLFAELHELGEFDFFRRINCGDGWEPIIRRLAVRMEAILQDMPVDERPVYRVIKVEEKYGGLHVYMHDATIEMRQLITQATSESYKICELCGEAGSIRQGLWVGTKTLCEKCRNNFVTGIVLQFSESHRK